MPEYLSAIGKAQHAMAVAMLILVAGCSIPGLKYQHGGSEAWRQGSTDTSAEQVKITRITPSLVSRMNKRAVEEENRPAVTGHRVKSPEWEYVVGKGDILSVIVWGHPELTNPTGEFESVESAGRVVRADGTIFFPHAGIIDVDGLTVEQIRLKLAESLARVIESPQVDVRVIAFRSQHVYVVGDVMAPCKLPVTDKPMNVLDAMNACGEHIRPSASHRTIVIERGQQRRVVDVHTLYRGEDPILNQPLVHGDKLYVEDDRWNRVFVVGEVLKQGALSIPVSGMTLAEALNAETVGGLALDSVDSAEIYVFRGVSEKELKSGKINTETFRPKVYLLDAGSVDALLLADQFQLKPRDIVYASAASLVNYNRGASQIIPTIQTLLQTGILVDRVR